MESGMRKKEGGGVPVVGKGMDGRNGREGRGAKYVSMYYE